MGYLSPDEYERKYQEESKKGLVEVLDNKKRKGITAKTLSCLTF